MPGTGRLGRGRGTCTGKAHTDAGVRSPHRELGLTATCQGRSQQGRRAERALGRGGLRWKRLTQETISVGDGRAGGPKHQINILRVKWQVSKKGWGIIPERGAAARRVERKEPTHPGVPSPPSRRCPRGAGGVRCNQWMCLQRVPCPRATSTSLTEAPSWPEAGLHLRGYNWPRTRQVLSSRSNGRLGTPVRAKDLQPHSSFSDTKGLWDTQEPHRARFCKRACVLLHRVAFSC